MATKVVTLDDLDGTSEAAETVLYLLDGQYLELDLSADNAKKFREALAPFAAVSRPVQAKDAARRIAANGSMPTLHVNGNGVPKPEGDFDPAVVRAWAIANGHQIGDKGRVPQNLVAAWRQEQANKSSASA